MRKSIQWLTLAEVSSRAGLKERDALRRLDRLERYMCGRNFGDIIKYPPQTAELMLAVTNLYRLGWDTEDIEELLDTTSKAVVSAVGCHEMGQNKASLVALDALLEQQDRFKQTLKTVKRCMQDLSSLAGGMAVLMEATEGENRSLKAELEKMKQLSSAY